MSLFCYAFSVAYALWIGYTHICDCLSIYISIYLSIYIRLSIIYKKKQILSGRLCRAHLECVCQWQDMWLYVETSIGSEDNVEHIIDWKMWREEFIQRLCVNVGG